MNSALVHTVCGITSTILKRWKGGGEMTDIVHYKLPFWFLGDIAHGLFVKKQLQDIFDFRTVKVEDLFGKFELKRKGQLAQVFKFTVVSKTTVNSADG